MNYNHQVALNENESTHDQNKTPAPHLPPFPSFPRLSLYSRLTSLLVVGAVSRTTTLAAIALLSSAVTGGRRFDVPPPPPDVAAPAASAMMDVGRRSTDWETGETEVERAEEKV